MRSITHFPSNDNREYLSVVCHSIMLLAIALGIYVRMKGLGQWPLADDEYYIAKSVKNILASGVPKFQCGGYYTRGLLYQYLAAPFLYFFSNDEFYLRIIPATFNILAIPPLYWLGKRLSGVTGACIAVSLFSLSLWEIEFSRFARMYCPFQTIFLWYIFCLYRVVVEKIGKYEKWMHVLSLVAVFVYEASIFLLALNFIPLLFIPKSRKKANICTKIVLFIFGYFFLSTDFRHLGVEYYLPPEIQTGLAHKAGITLSTVLIPTLPSNFLWTLLFIIPLSVAILSGYNLVRSTNLKFPSKMGICAVLLLSQLNLFGLVILLSSILVLLDIIAWNSATKRILKQCLLVVLLSFIFWGVYCFTTVGWQQYIGHTEPVSWKKILLILFNYPDIYSKIIRPWMQTIPVLTVISSLIIIFGTLEFFKKPFEQGIRYRLLCSLIIILCLFVSTVNLPYHETRYTFFLYPIIILLLTDSMIRLAKFVSPNPIKSASMLVIFTLTFCGLTEDFGIDHMKKIDSKEVNFRLDYGPSRTRHYYTRRDYRTPALTINEQIKDGDIVISLLTPPDYYLKHLDYIYIDSRSKRLPGVVACSGTKELWSNANLIYKEANLWHILDHHPSTVWIIAASDTPRYSSGKSVEMPRKLRAISEKISQRYNLHPYKTSVDGMIDVYKVDPSNKL